MARTAKTVKKETEEKKPSVEVSAENASLSKKGKLKMLRTYMGPAGIFYAGKVYEFEGEIYSSLLKNKDAIEC